MSKPAAVAFVVNSDSHASERSELTSNFTQIFVGKRAVDCESEQNVLSVSADVSHLLKGLSVQRRKESNRHKGNPTEN